MGSIISAIYDDIKLHGSVEAARAWRDREEIPYFPDPEVVERKIEGSEQTYNDKIDALNNALRAHLRYIRANKQRHDQKGNINTRVGIT